MANQEVETCTYCGRVDEAYDENSGLRHDASPKHVFNKILYEYKKNRKQFTGNRHGMVVTCCVNSSYDDLVNVDKAKIILSTRPNESVKFRFRIDNDTKNSKMLIVGIDLAHPQAHFQMNDHGFRFGEEPYVLEPKSTVPREISVTFTNNELSHFEMPIVFTFHNPDLKKNIIIVREMVIFVEENKVIHEKTKSPYTDCDVDAKQLYRSSVQSDNSDVFLIPKKLKTIFGHGLKIKDYTSEEDRDMIMHTKEIFETGPTEENHVWFFHNLLWYEETIARINLKKYNMANVYMHVKDDFCVLEVPGLAEKRPSLLRGDMIFIRPHNNEDVMFEGKITDIQDCNIHISGLNYGIFEFLRALSTFDVRFIMSRVVFERMHNAIHRVLGKQKPRIFPEPSTKIPNVQRIKSFFNPDVAKNGEQQQAVEHIVSGTAGLAPYMVFGPPGTGKTITIVEAILQIVKQSPTNRILVCTDSNMAGDHIACAIIKYESQINVPNLLLRANSQFRVWEVLPKELIPHSNGQSYKTFKSVPNAKLANYRIVVTTLSHSAKYGNSHQQNLYHLAFSHLFIDEAAQASETACAIPISSLLKPKGSLVLAGDPKQLGPVCISRNASIHGLGVSFMERLFRDYKHMYAENPSYITMLKNNFRSHKDILEIPNNLFYDDQLRACAPLDPLSDVDILPEEGKTMGRAIVFHAVMSMEQKEGKSPSFFNMEEIEMVKKYVTTLIKKHKVKPEEIGVVTPYVRQMFKIRVWLVSQGYDIEVGTVEAFQGKEKRVIIITTVRANCRLLDHDAKYQLGFLVDDKRFNVAITRAKSKAIIIGNPTCLCKDLKWRTYMDKCKEYKSYYGSESEQLARTTALLRELAVTRFEKTRITEELALLKNNDNNNNKQRKRRNRKKNNA